MNESTVRHHYTQDVERVFALMTDADFLKRRAEAANDKEVVVEVDRSGPQLKIQISHEVEQNLPSFMKRFFSGRNRLIDRQTWSSEGPAHINDWTVQIGDGKRIQLSGRLTLAPGDAGGCDLVSSIKVSASIPLVAGRIEKYVLGESEVSMKRQIAFATAELGG